MNNSDPWLRDFFIGVKRFASFIILSSLISFFLWMLIILFKLNFNFGDLKLWWHDGWKPREGHNLAQLILYGCWLTGLQSTAIFYLVMWVRWLKLGNINGYQRGAQIDQRSM